MGSLYTVKAYSVHFCPSLSCRSCTGKQSQLSMLVVFDQPHNVVAQPGLDRRVRFCPPSSQTFDSHNARYRHEGSYSKGWATSAMATARS